MALQKSRNSKTRGRKRRTHYKAVAPQVVECPQCKAPMVPHRACKECGYYNGREAIRVES
jgi:large subunit ribosomal protein L32